MNLSGRRVANASTRGCGLLRKPRSQHGASGLKQAERYARRLTNTGFNSDGYGVPFLYSTNGEIIWFRDVRHELNVQRKITRFHTPGGDDEKFDSGVLPQSYLADPSGKEAFVYVSTNQRMAIKLLLRGGVASARRNRFRGGAGRTARLEIVKIGFNTRTLGSKLLYLAVPPRQPHDDERLG